jgi:ketosteroid isomerase-like protein
MDDALSRYCAATEAGDVDGFMATMAPDVEVVSPISGRMVFRGEDDVRFLLSAVYGTANRPRRDAGGRGWPGRPGADRDRL